MVWPQSCAGKSDPGKQTLGTGPRKNFGGKLRVSQGRGLPAYWTGRHARFGAEGEFVLSQTAHTALVHDQHHNVSAGGANLKSEATAFDADRLRRNPTVVGWLAAYGKTSTVLGAHDEPRLLQSRHDDGAMRLLQQVLGVAFGRRRHDF